MRGVYPSPIIPSTPPRHLVTQSARYNSRTVRWCIGTREHSCNNLQLLFTLFTLSKPRICQLIFSKNYLEISIGRGFSISHKLQPLPPLVPVTRIAIKINRAVLLGYLRFHTPNFPFLVSSPKTNYQISSLNLTTYIPAIQLLLHPHTN